MRAWLWLGLAGCAGEKEASDDTCTVGAAEGAIEASVDGEPWEATATWTEAGEGVQVVTPTTGGWRLTIVAQRALAALEVGDLPVVIDLAGDEGFVTAYPEAGGSSFSSSNGSGSLSFTALDGDLLSGCFTAEALSADGDPLAIAGAEFVATGL